MHLVMFDIDGTLVDSDAFDAELYARAVRDVLGISIDDTWAQYEHVTDSGILEEILRVPDFDGRRDRLYAEVKRRFIALTQDYLARHAGACAPVPGARELLRKLRTADTVAMAIATGGWRETAVLKLTAARIPFDGLTLASSSEACARTDIMRMAEREAAKAARPIRRTYFGDGAWDKRACEKLGYDFIAVGGKVAHAVAFDDLSDHAAILGRLGLEIGTANEACAHTGAES